MKPVTTGIALLAILATLLTPAGASAQEPDRTVPHDRSGPAFDMQGVAAAIEADEEAHLLVSLALPSNAGVGRASTAVDLASLRQGVATAQQSVVAAMSDPTVGASSAASAEFGIRHQFEAIPALAVTIRSRAALERLAQNPTVIGIRLDTGGTAALAASVPFINADQRHAVGNLGDGVTVAVLDTGVDLDHPDLVDDVLAAQACFGALFGEPAGVGFCPNGNDRQTGAGAGEDDDGHGTHVAGIVTSAGAVSSPGVAPAAEIVSVKVIGDCGHASCFVFFSEIVAAWDWIINNNDTLGIDVINMSILTDDQFSGDCDTSYPAASIAIGTLRSLGITPFASAGNNGGSLMSAPACLRQVISVGATDIIGNITGFSDSNATTDIFAPGRGITSSARGGGTATYSGTSMASPHAAGCAALLIDAGESTTPDEIETRLETSSFRVTNREGLTFPRVNCALGDVGPTPCVDDGESNDTLHTATPLAFATDIAAQICANEADWYSFDVLAGDTVDISVAFTNAHGDIDVLVRNPLGALFRFSDTTTDNEAILVVAPQTGTYLVRVYGFGQAENAYRLRVDTAACGEPVFDDVPQASASVFFTDPVYWASCTGVTTGTSSTTFTPNAPVTRGQLATFLWRLAGEPTVSSGPLPFNDVPQGVFFTEPVRWMVDQNITTGTSSTTFSPHGPVTRGQLATFLWRFAGEPSGAPTNSFDDVPDGLFFTLPIDWLADTGITTGTSPTTFNPDTNLTRGEAVTFLSRLDAQQGAILF